MIRCVLACAALLTTTCQSSPSAPALRPLPPPPATVRVASAMASWGWALRSGDPERLADAEDGEGQLALVYVAIKALASQVPDGGEAAKQSLGWMITMTFLRAIAGADDSMDGPMPVVIPANTLGIA
jgi:hypothetical protein